MLEAKALHKNYNVRDKKRVKKTIHAVDGVDIVLKSGEDICTCRGKRLGQKHTFQIAHGADSADIRRCTSG